MDPLRQKAYRHLLFVMLLDMRARTAFVGRGKVARWWSPLWWRKVLATCRDLHTLADAFHNLSAYDAKDFENFDERAFWRVEGYQTRFVTAGGIDYDKAFNDALVEKSTSG